MLTSKTVFIVGAGASKEIGLPVGFELKDDIARMLTNGASTNGIFGHYKTQLDTVLSLYSANNSVSVDDARSQIVSALPMAISIDNYLHTHRNNPHLTYIGKAAIAFSIIAAERESKIHIPRFNKLKSATLQNTWYNILSQILFEGVFTTNIEDVFNNISFVIFNYDRCIEHYLINVLKEYFNTSNEVAVEIVKEKLVGFHPYGSLGPLWDEPNQQAVKYGAEYINDNHIFVQGIRTFTEVNTDSSASDLIQKELESATQIVFLGCAYHRLNMNFINTQSVGERKVYGTGLNMSMFDKEIITDSIVNLLKTNIKPVIQSETCFSFLRDISMSLKA